MKSISKTLLFTFVLFLMACEPMSVPGSTLSASQDEQAGSEDPNNSDNGNPSDGAAPNEPTPDPTEEDPKQDPPPTEEPAPPTADDNPYNLPLTAMYGARYVPRSKTPIASDVFVSPGGSSISSCTQSAPCSLARGLNVGAGKFVWLMDGVYRLSSKISVPSNTTLEAISPKKAILDFKGSKGALDVKANNTVVRNIVIRNVEQGAGDGAIRVAGNNNLVDGVVAENNYPTGIRVTCNMGYRAAVDAVNSGNPPPLGNYNRVIDSVAMNNYGGGDSDGLSITCGRGNEVLHLTTIDNSDDGIDTWCSYETTMDSNLSYGNGWVDGKAAGNGTGIKTWCRPAYEKYGNSSVVQMNTVTNNWTLNNRVQDYSIVSNDFRTQYSAIDRFYKKISGNVCGQNKNSCSVNGRE